MHEAMQISRHWRMNDLRVGFRGVKVGNEVFFRPPHAVAVPQNDRLESVIENIHETTEIDPRVAKELAEQRWANKQASRSEVGQLIHALCFYFGYGRDMLTYSIRQSQVSKAA